VNHPEPARTSFSAPGATILRRHYAKARAIQTSHSSSIVKITGMFRVWNKCECRLHNAMFGVEGKAENICSLGVFRILTHLIHERLAGCEFRRPLASAAIPMAPAYLHGAFN
jgi:hypothetical protein